MQEKTFSERYEEEFALRHYGVKGMKWGKRKAKPTGVEINQARERYARDVAKINNEVAKGRDAYDRGDMKTAKRQGTKAENLRKQALSNQAVAARLTRGEKFAHVLTEGPFAALTIGGNALEVRALEKRAREAQ